MIKYFCDACGEEIVNEFTHNKFNVKCHIKSIVDGDLTHANYVDAKMNAISGREVSHLLCAKCYNIVMIEAIKTFNKIKLESGLVGKEALKGVNIVRPSSNGKVF